MLSLIAYFRGFMRLTSNHNASPKIFENARFLKKVMSPAESLLWRNLRGSRLNGLKFRRQHPIKTYILDFYCHEKQLAVEIDGEIHENPENRQYDESRTKELSALNIQVIRFSNQEVLNNISEVLKRIKEHTK
jgi:very-short-patch-repair endonuclease